MITNYSNPHFKFGNYQGFRKAPYSEKIIKKSLYIKMRDDDRIATEVVFPAVRPANVKLPTVLYQTRYRRAVEYRYLFKWMKQDEDYFFKILCSNGYVVLWSDVRGTGASFGFRPYLLSEEEQKDSKDIIDWIIKQPWSDGQVVCFGNSYAGSTCQLAATQKHPALKAISPRANEFDAFTDIAFPGGLLSKDFMKHWSKSTQIMDSNKFHLLYDGPLALIAKGCKPVDEDKDRTLLQGAIQDHANNWNIYEKLINIQFRDDKWGDVKPSDTFSPYTHLEEIEEWGGPVYHWGSWMDAYTSDVTIKNFLNLSNATRCIIGSWNHNGRTESDPYENHKQPATLKYIELIYELIRFFDYFVGYSKKNGWVEKKCLYYYTMGERKWQSTPEWPISNTKYIKYFFSEANELSIQKPTNNEGKDDYAVNYEYGSGKTNRWASQMTGGIVHYNDRSQLDKKLLTYTTKPLQEDTEITGHLEACIYLSTTHSDGALIVYFEAVAPDGKVTYISEGELRLLHRKVVDPPYQIIGPYHSFKKEDALPIIPGEVMEVQMRIIPTSILIKQATKLRISIAGADVDLYDRYPAMGNPILSVYRDHKFASYVIIPIIPRNQK